MKKVYFLLAGFALLAASCSSEEAIAEKKNAFTFNKTPEMVNFESSLKQWMSNPKGDAKQQKISAEQMERQAITFLQSLNVDTSQITAKQKVGSHEVISLAMKEYSKTLTVMFNQNQ